MRTVCIAFVSLALFVAGCSGNGLQQVPLQGLDGEALPAGTLTGNRASIFVFLDPVCPLSQNYTRNLQDFQDRYGSDGVRVIGIFPGDIKAAAVRAFMKRYRCTFPVALDPDFAMTDFFDATVTPEVIMTAPGGEILYRGAIDNWAIDLGKKRQRASAYYLQDALNDVLSGKPVRLAETEPVGCYIEKLR
jgi:peroxiredoxin